MPWYFVNIATFNPNPIHGMVFNGFCPIIQNGFHQLYRIRNPKT